MAVMSDADEEGPLAVVRHGVACFGRSLRACTGESD